MFLELMAQVAANPVSSVQIREAQKVERAALRTVKKAEKSIREIPALVISTGERETVMGMQSIATVAGAYTDARMAAFPIGTWGMGLVSFLGMPAVCRKVCFTPFNVSAVNCDNGDAVIGLADESVTAWLFEDGTWLTDGEASTLITVLR